MPGLNSMKRFLLIAFALLLVNATFAEFLPLATSELADPQIVEVRSGTLHLKAYFWKPRAAGPFPRCYSITGQELPMLSTPLGKPWPKQPPISPQFF